jgi:hypothetical protein
MQFASNPDPQHNAVVHQFWHTQIQQLEQSEIDFKSHPLPLARIKKVMKSDPEVKVCILCSIFKNTWPHRCELIMTNLLNMVSKWYPQKHH